MLPHDTGAQRFLFFYRDFAKKNWGPESKTPSSSRNIYIYSPRNSHHKSEQFTKLRTKRVAALQLQGMLLGGCKLPGNRMT